MSQEEMLKCLRDVAPTIEEFVGLMSELKATLEAGAEAGEDGEKSFKKNLKKQKTLLRANMIVVGERFKEIKEKLRQL